MNIYTKGSILLFTLLTIGILSTSFYIYKRTRPVPPVVVVTAPAENCGKIIPQVLTQSSLNGFSPTEVKNLKCMDAAVLACTPAYQTYSDVNTSITLAVSGKNASGQCSIVDTIKPTATSTPAHKATCSFSDQVITNLKLNSPVSGQISNGINALIVFALANLPRGTTGLIDIGSGDKNVGTFVSIPCDIAEL